MAYHFLIGCKLKAFKGSKINSYKHEFGILDNQHKTFSMLGENKPFFLKLNFEVVYRSKNYLRDRVEMV